MFLARSVSGLECNEGEQENRKKKKKRSQMVAGESDAVTALPGSGVWISCGPGGDTAWTGRSTSASWEQVCV